MPKGLPTAWIAGRRVDLPEAAPSIGQTYRFRVSALDDSLEPYFFEHALGSVGRLGIGVWAHAHAVVAISTGPEEKGRKIILLQGFGHCQRVTFLRERSNLENDRSLWD